MQENAFGTTILNARTRLGLSRRQLAEMTGISQPWIQRLESHTYVAGGKTIKARPSLDTIRTLARALKLDYEALVKAAGYTDEDLHKPHALEELEHAIKCLDTKQIPIVLAYVQGLLDTTQS